MSGEQQSTETEVIPEETTQEEELSQEQMDAAFDAGFSGDPVKEPPEEKPAEDVKPEEKPEQQPAEDDDKTGAEAEQASAEDETPPPVLAGLTEDQVKDLLAKASEVDSLREELNTTKDRLFGRYGEVQQRLKELQESAPTATEAAGVKITADKLKHVAEEFGEEFAVALANDLSDIGMGGDGEESTGLDERFQTYSDTIMSETDKRIETRMLSFMRPGWTEEVGSQDFALFKSQMSPEDRQSFDESWSADHINGVLKDFDQWKDRVSQQTEQQQQADRQAEQDKREAEKASRLEQAINPRGTQTDHAPSEEDAFEAGFNSA